MKVAQRQGKRWTVKRPLYVVFSVIGPYNPPVGGHFTTSQVGATPDRLAPADCLSVAHPPLTPRKWRLDGNTAGFASGVPFPCYARATLGAGTSVVGGLGSSRCCTHAQRKARRTLLVSL